MGGWMRLSGAFISFALAVGFFLTALTRDRLDVWIDRAKLPLVLSETSVEVRDRNGQLLRAYQVGDGIWRLTPGPVDATYVTMLKRYEDKRFDTHAGVDPMAMLRAVGQALWNGGTVSGGSTLTMQVARLLEDGSTGRWSGKLRQMRVAMALERRLSKEQILDLYLTHAPFGGNLEGVRAASLAWFGKEPRRLTAAQAALLVALPQSPETRRPDRHPDAARAARDRVLSRMQAQGVLPVAEVTVATAERLPRTQQPFPALAPHLADRQRAQFPDRLRHDVTLDVTAQASLERLIAQAAREAGRAMSAALVVADAKTGEILSSVGSPKYADDRQGFIDMTQAIRSPGSTLKPLVYGLAFDQGLAHPETLIHDGPVQFGRYAPRNFDGQFRGDVRVRDALQMSLNIPVVKLTNALGSSRLMSALRRVGTDPKLPTGKPGLAISLGGIGMSLQDLVQLYASLARGGQGVTLRDDLSTATVETGRVLSPVAAWHVGDILSGLTPPSGASSGVLAYKTGTSYGHRDAWAIGYDGRHVIGVWMGRADGTPVPGVFGGDLAAPVLFQAFGRLKPAFDPLPPPPAATLILGAAELPRPLQRFEVRANVSNGNRPSLIFPPNGARLDTQGEALAIKLRGGQAPFVVLANGVPVVRGMQSREFEIGNPGRGFSQLVVIDGTGRSDRANIRID
ncbi:penicillin-binding protein 1C [Tropicibacter sp. Alg240-R139]|uniref:penicillin-binding protein 1C n=1 Tax=Tropicibacter sp. Alg240-R139 TaxID=2305991 RepID=UPI001F082DF3|nr:penicillin-binding protein 1C [Tropicibacter sp. Alg240-R139]